MDAMEKVPPHRCWIKGQCKNKLLDGLDRAALSNAAVAFHSCLLYVGRLYLEFKMSPGKVEDVFDVVQASSGTFRAARDAAALLAHLHVCQPLEGPSN